MIERELVVSSLYQASDYQDGKYTPTGEVAVHFSEPGATTMMGPGSRNTATLNMSPEDAAKLSLGQRVKFTVTAVGGQA